MSPTTTSPVWMPIRTPHGGSELRVTPETLPIIDIVAEQSWATTPHSAAAMRDAHVAFVAHSRFRESHLAAGSTHDVMRDKPDLVVYAITRLSAWSFGERLLGR